MINEELILELKKENNLTCYNKVFDEVKSLFNVNVEEAVFWKKIWFYSGKGIEDEGEHIVFLVFVSFLKKRIYLIKIYFEGYKEIKIHLVSFSEFVIKRGEKLYSEILTMKLYFVESGNKVEIENGKEIFIQEIKEEIEKSLNEMKEINFY